MTTSTATKTYSLSAAKGQATRLTNTTGIQHEFVAAGNDLYTVQAVAQAVAAKRTNITLHINTGTKKENGNNKQLHAVLWNHEDRLDTFFGGVAEVTEGKLEVVTAPVEVEGKTYQNAAQQLALFVNRNKKGRVMALSLTRDGVKVGEIKFKKTINGKELLTGTYNEAGLQFDAEYHVVAGVEGNRAIFAEVKGGLRDEIVAAMIGKKAATPANDEAAKVAA